MREHCKMLRFNFQQNRTINEEFDFSGVKVVGGVRVAPILKFRKSLIQNDITNPHRKFQHSISIRKCLKIGVTDLTFGGLKVLRGG